jgi:CRISPR-associated protein, Csn1 family
MSNEKLFVGLDVGSDSVGWAATNENYDILRLKGKTAWGASIFDEAQSAAQRRTFRCSGRRYERRKYRLSLLNDMFDSHLKTIDPTFLLRLSESAYTFEDKSQGANQGSLLFLDREKEKDFYTIYPTIWHLRSHLIEGDPKAFSDLRNVYLALHHIIKYRGNFLSESSLDATKFDETVFDRINDFFRSLLAEETESDESDVDFVWIGKDGRQDFLNCLLDKRTNKTEKKKTLKKLLGTNETADPYTDMAIALVCGGVFDLSKLGDGFEKNKIAFGKDFDEKEEEYRGYLGTSFELVEEIKAIYDYVELHEILNGEKLLSKAFANLYDAHKIQLHGDKTKGLSGLKNLLIGIDRKQGNKTPESRFYYKVFKDPNLEKNYAAFVHVGTTKKRPTIHEFNAFVLDILKSNSADVADQKSLLMLENLAENDELLQTIAYRSTSVIPHQLHEKELGLILDQCQKFYPWLFEMKRKILDLFLFRIPYYFGPLDSRSQNSSVVRNSNVTITPWNIDAVVDKDQTRAKFMGSLTNRCTYLREENVLPKQSLLFEEYEILNKVNGLKVNGLFLDKDIKGKLVTALLAKSKTTFSGLKKLLLWFNPNLKKDGVSVSGLNEKDDFVASSHACLAKAFDLTKDYATAERIIFLATIFCDSKIETDRAIRKEFPALSEEQRKAVGSLVCKGWAPFSRKLLTGLKHTDENGVVMSILDVLREENLTFMAVLHDQRFGFEELITEENRKAFGERPTFEVVKEIFESIPPKMQRSTEQAIRIVDDVVKASKRKPNRIFIEVTRNEDEKKKNQLTISRKKELEAFLKGLFKEKAEGIADRAKHVYDELEKRDVSDLKGKHLYLYFKQNGLDLYTGRPIDIGDVLDATKYDTDHIVPQSVIKDDSLDNLALVNREANQRLKGKRYPLPPEIRNNQDVLRVWKILKEKKQLSDKKFNNLMRTTPITDEEIATFVSSQINVVNHSNIAIRDIFAIKYPQAKLVFSKAQYPSHIRQTYSIPKLRHLNDCHHAVDAYLNVVAGNILYEQFGDLRLIKARNSMSEEEREQSFNMERTLERILGLNKLGEKVKNNCYRHDFLLTYRHLYQDSSFYDMTIYPVGAKSGLVPLHTKKGDPRSNVSKYGGYNGLATEYFVIGTKKNGKRVLVSVPHLYASLYKKMAELSAAVAALQGEPGLQLDTSHKIPSNQKVLINGCYYLLCPFNESIVTLKPIVPLFFPVEESLYLLRLQKLLLDDPLFKNLESPEFSFYSDKKKEHKQSVSSQKNVEILQEIIKDAESKKYDFCPMICAIRRFDVSGFAQKKMCDQAVDLFSLISLFGRKSLSLCKNHMNNYFSKAKNAFFSENVISIDESPSGLFEQRRIL